MVILALRGDNRFQNGPLYVSLSELMYRFPISHGLRFCTVGKLRISSIDSICIKVSIIKFNYSKSSVKKNVTYISVRLYHLFGEGDLSVPFITMTLCSIHNPICSIHNPFVPSIIYFAQHTSSSLKIRPPFSAYRAYFP